VQKGPTNWPPTHATSTDFTRLGNKHEASLFPSAFISQGCNKKIIVNCVAPSHLYKPLPNPYMRYSTLTSSYMQPSERVRRQWLAFEQWVETVPRVAMEKQILETFRDMDAKWNATPTRTRATKQDHDKDKAAFRRELEDGLVTLAREEWQRRLEVAGLKDEDWGEMAFTETLAVERLLGGDLDEEGMAIMERVARANDDTVISHTGGLPALTNATRTSNSSGYSFVSPMSLSIADDDEGDGFESWYM